MEKKLKERVESMEVCPCHIGLVDAVICTSLPIKEAESKFNMSNPTGIHSRWTYDGKKKNKMPCPDILGRMHYRLFC